MENVNGDFDQNAAIDRLIAGDENFKMKLDMVKAKIIDSLNVYGDSIGKFELFTKSEVAELGKAKKSITSSLTGLQERLNIGSIGAIGKAAGKKGQESVLGADATPVFIEKIDPVAAMAIATALGTIKEDGSGTGGYDAKVKGSGKGFLGEMKDSMFEKTGVNAMVSKFGGKVGAIAAKAGPVAALIAGIVWAVMDGIKGFFKADEWGVSKLSGVIGGVLGGTDKGLKGAMKGMGKWALIGAGIGSFFIPVVGTIVGGLIGAVVGALLGWIGGKRIAKFLQGIGDFFTNWYEAAVEVVTGWFDKLFDAITFITDLKDKLFEILGIDKAIKWIEDKLGNLFGGFKDGFGAGISQMFSVITEWNTKIFDWISSKLGELFGGFKDGFWSGIVGIFDTVNGWISGIWDTIKGYLLEVWKKFEATFPEAAAKLKEWVSTIKDKLIGAFDAFREGLVEKVEKIKGFLGAIIEKIKGALAKIDPRNWGKSAEEIEEAQKKREARAEEFKDGLENIGNKFKGWFGANEAELQEAAVMPTPSDDKALAATKQALEESNKMALEENKKQSKARKETKKNQEKSNELLEELAVQLKGVNRGIGGIGGGGGDVQMDLGGMREAAFDGSFDHRSKFYGKRR